MSTDAPQTYLSAEEAIDLSACDREPIHIPGAIQPHGVLVVLDAETLDVVQVSANAAALFGQPPEALVGQPLDVLLGAPHAGLFRARCAAVPLEDGSPPLSFALAPAGAPSAYEAILHRSGPHLVLELEPSGAYDNGDAAHDIHRQLQSVIERVQEARSLQRLSEIAVEEVRRLTGFDRVKLYRFDADWNGRVVAESRAEHMASYLGLHFPATDIPAQARALYTVNRTRLIVDAAYEPAPLVPALSPLTGQPLDLSHSTLRSVSPVHVQYLKNMGVQASMSISIVHEGQLWGLLACHHAAPRFVAYTTRMACALLSQVLALLLADQQEIEDQAYLARLGEIQKHLLEAMVRAQTYTEGLMQQQQKLLTLVGATGAALVTADETMTMGETPPEEVMHGLAAWLAPRLDDEPFATEALAEVYPPAAGFEEAASGLLAVSLSRLQPSVLLWFRPELPKTIYWAGAPTKAVGIDDAGAQRLSPRHSFEAWAEIQRGRSAPWRPGEVAAAQALRIAISDVVFATTERIRRLNASLKKANEELERRNRELQDFAYVASHDLQEPLRKIRAFSGLLADEYEATLDEQARFYLSRVVDGAGRMSRLLADLLVYSRVMTRGQDFVATNLHHILADVLHDLDLRIEETDAEIDAGPLPTIEADAGQMRRLLFGLLDNALKFRHPARPPRIRIQARHAPSPAASDDEPPYVHLVVEDNGIGFDEKYIDRIFTPFQRLHGRGTYEGTGMGLAIARRIVERHGGHITATSTPGEGSRFVVTLPLRPAQPAG